MNDEGQERCCVCVWRNVKIWAHKENCSRWSHHKSSRTKLKWNSKETFSIVLGLQCHLSKFDWIAVGLRYSLAVICVFGTNVTFVESIGTGSGGSCDVDEMIYLSSNYVQQHAAPNHREKALCVSGKRMPRQIQMFFSIVMKDCRESGKILHGIDKCLSGSNSRL